MVQANDSITVTPGTGATVATHLVGGKEYQVVMVAGSGGNILGTRDTYVMYAPPVSVVGANKFHFDLFNATGSAKDMEIVFASFFSDLDVAVVGVLAVRIDAFRTTAVGTGGTTFATEATTAVRTIFRPEPTAAALPAQVTAREFPTGGGTSGAFLGSAYTQPEESATSMGYITQLTNVFDGFSADAAAGLVVPEGQGIKFVQGPIASVGKVGCRIVFTLS